MANEVATLPPNVVARGIDAPQWNTLCSSIFPGAKVDSVLMYVDYCRARKLDIMKRPAHIVPMKVKQGESWVWRDVVMPGIYEYRTTAQRTGFYLGHSEPEYGPDIEFAGVLAPAWVYCVFKRWNPIAGIIAEFPVKTYFAEVVALTKDKIANDRWYKAPIQMMTKCNEAAGLREAFPDEFGGTQTIEELDGRIVDARALGLAVNTVSDATQEEETLYGDEREWSDPKPNPLVKEPEPEPTASNLATEPQRKMIYAKLNRAGISKEEFEKQMGYSVDKTPFDEVNGVLKWIGNQGK